MSDIPIHQLPPAEALTGAEIVPVDDGSATVRTTIGAIRSGLAVSGHGHAVAEVSGLQAALDGKLPAGAATVSIGGPAGGESLRVLTGSNLVDRIEISGGTLGQGVSLAAKGLSGAVPLYYAAQGAGSHWFMTDGFRSAQFHVAHTANADRHVVVTGSSGGDPSIGTTGGRLSLSAVPALPGYTVSTLPSVAARGLVYVSDGSGNRRLAISDGVAWRFPDGAVIS